MSTEMIKIQGAKVHNLKNVSLDLPKNKLIVFTGVSGCGKSSLAFDTIYSEGQRKYVESLSSYARQFLGIMEKADVELIEGLSPAISIDQKSASHNPRSTVGTVTEIYDYLRLLFAKIGKAYDPKTNKLLESQTVQEIVLKVLDQKFIQDKKESLKVMILAPLVSNRKGTYEELFERLKSKGFVRVRVDGEIRNLEEDIKLDKFKKHNIELVADRVVLGIDNTEQKKRITDSIELALGLGEGRLIISYEQEKWIDVVYSETAVMADGTAFPKIEPNLFSFNSPVGACKNCLGLGHIVSVVPELIYNPKLTISEGGIFPISKSFDNENSWTFRLIESVCEKHHISMKVKMSELTEKQLNILFYGTEEKQKFEVESVQQEGRIINANFEGIINNLERRYKETDSEYIRSEISQYMRESLCTECGGKRLSKNSLCVKINNRNIDELARLNIQSCLVFFEELVLESDNDKIIATPILREVINRLKFLNAVGLNYLSLNRTAKTLSGGESQRIRLASQIGSGLTGVLYVLDEPSIGLHQKDNDQLIKTLKHLRDLGNTVIVVEHDEDTIMAADWVVDIGPMAGIHGGEIIHNGLIKDLLNNPKSITAKYLNSKIQTPVKNRKIKNSDKLEIINATENNLKNVNVTIPLHQFVAVTGSSGSGKSSLINQILSRKLMNFFYGSTDKIGKHEHIKGISLLDKVVIVDQSPIGRTPRSNPATYTGVFNFIRDIYSQTQESKIRGYGPGRFSFNTKGGRCEKCQGDGVKKIEMNFLPDVYVTCEECKGSRYNSDTLEIDFKGKNIADILNMTIEEARLFFENISFIKNRLDALTSVGLGYIKMGQSATTLSGGEAQRVKLATELSKRQTGKTMYILDEPTTGLHFYDIEKLLEVLHSLVDKGNSVVVIEHNLDVIKTADYIIDMGPNGGDEGGQVIYQGEIEGLIKCQNSHTGYYLNKLLQSNSHYK